MSNKSSPVVMRISPAVLIFLVLMLIMGALTLASTNINPGSTTRAEFTPEFTSWSSPDNVVQFDYPSSWQPSVDQSHTLTYDVTAPQQLGTLQIFYGSIASLTQGMTLSNNPDAEEVLRNIFSNPNDSTKAANLPVQKTTLAGLPAIGTHQTIQQTDPQTNQQTNVDVEIWIVSLDSKNIMVVQEQAKPDDWPTVQPGFDHIKQTLKIDVPSAINQLQNVETLTPEATAASAGTAVATSAATQASPATAVATAAQ